MGFLEVYREAKLAGVRMELVDGGLQVTTTGSQRNLRLKVLQYKTEISAHLGGSAVTEVDETPELATCASVTAHREFPIHTLPGAVGRFVAEASRAIGCDASFVALPMLGCLSRAIGNRRVIQLKATWKEYANIWAAVIGKSGTAKSPALHEAMQFLDRAESRSFSRHAEVTGDYQQELSLFERDLAVWKKLKTTEPPPSRPEPPTCERFVTSDSTIEALASILAGQFDGILVVRDELAGWLNGMGEYKAGKGSDLGHWLAAWSGAPLCVDRKTGAVRTMRVERASVSLVGGIQPGVLREAIGREHMQDGLCARLLMSMPDPKPVTWSEAVVDPRTVGEVAFAFEALLSLEAATDPDGNAEPFALGLTTEARELWAEYFNRHRAELSELDDDLAAAWSKLEAYTARFSLIIQLCSWATGDASGEAVDESSMQAAITLSDWFGGEAKRVYGLFVESEVERDTRELQELIKRLGGRVTARDLAHSSRRHRGPGEAEAALDRLIKLGRGTWHVERTQGRPRQTFILGAVNSGNGSKSIETPENGALTLPQHTQNGHPGGGVA